MAKLAHINIRTSRYEETITFYERLLGFRRARSPVNPDLEKNTWLLDAGGNPWIHVNSLPAAEPQRTAASSLDHVAFNCEDLDTFAARLVEMQVPFDTVRTRVPGVIQVNLKDPNGIRIELTFGHQRLEPEVL